MKRIYLQAVSALMTALAVVSCSKEQPVSGDGNDGRVIPVTFTMSTPAGEAVPYASMTRANSTIHDESEWTINKLTVYVYAVDESQKGTFLRRYATDASGDESIDLVSNGAGTYTFTMKAPVSDMNAKRRFIFLANDDSAAPGDSESQDRLQDKTAHVELTDGASADKLAAKGTGIAMSGTATLKDGGHDDIVTIKPGVQCEVKLTRIVARVDVKNNTPNLVISSIKLLNAAPKGYLFPHDPIKAAAESYITENMNANVTLGTTYEAQKDLKKVFYLYERQNEDEDNSAQIEIKYKVNNSDGIVTVPFRNTSEPKDFVDVERNHLYTVVLGDGKPVVTNEVKFTFKVEEWNSVDTDEAVDPNEDAQMKKNKALMVNMFTEYNVKTLDKAQKKVTFYDRLDVTVPSDPKTAYFTWDELQTAGLTVQDKSACVTDESGNKYRLPTEGELNLLIPMYTEPEKQPDLEGIKSQYYPWWNDNPSTNTGNIMVTTEFDETIYLKNGADNMPDKGRAEDPEYTVKGQSQLKLGRMTGKIDYPTKSETAYNIYPVYGVRFKGSDQCAAYRWETCQIAGNPLERYLSIKIKALGKKDISTTIDQVAQEAFWKDGFIEYKFPASGYYTPQNADSPTSENITHRGVNGYCWSSSLWKDGYARNLNVRLSDTNVGHSVFSHRFPLRLVKVSDAVEGDE